MGAAFRFGWSGSRSRRRQAREQEPAACEGVRWATLPCPAGARGAASMRERRCLPHWGKSASELARLVLVCHGREQKVGALCPSGTAGRRAGGWSRGEHPTREWAQHWLQPFCADKIQRSAPSARPVSHAVPRGDRRALPAPAQGIHPLRIPFWGTGLVFLRPPSPNVTGGRLLLLSLPPSTPIPAPTEPKRSIPAPFVTGRGCVAFGPTALAVDTVD